MSRKKNKENQDIQELANKFYWSRSEEDYQNLFNRIYWGLLTYISKNFIKGNFDDCNDVLIGVMEKIWTKIDMYDPLKANFSTWIYKIAMNDSLLFLKNRNYVSSKKYDKDINDLYSATLSGGGSEFFIYQEDLNYTTDGDKIKSYEDITDDMYDASVKCIDKLPDNFRLVLREQLINKKSIEQIAYDNQIKKTTLVNWLYKGRQALKEIIKSENEELYDDWSMGKEKYLSME